MPTENPDERKGERIAKLLARAGVASRRDVERMIADGRIAIGGVAVTTPATLLRSLHGVTVDAKPVAAPAPARLFLFNKPAGLLVTERDPAGRPTIYTRLPADLPRLVPVGRLDLATEGLLLLTTDGGLKRQLELPATGVERTYRARAYGDITQGRLEELIDGIEIDGIRYGPIDANMERRTGANGWIELTLTEGKNREVRRVLEHLGLQVSRLIRTRYGPFVLGDLQAGEVGEARQVDLVAFRRALDARRPKTEERIAVAPRAAPVPVAASGVEPDQPRRQRVAPARPAPATRSDKAAPRSGKPAAGWGTRARPSRPAAGARGIDAAAHDDDTDRRSVRRGNPAGSGEQGRRPTRAAASPREEDGAKERPSRSSRAAPSNRVEASDRSARPSRPARGAALNRTDIIERPPRPSRATSGRTDRPAGDRPRGAGPRDPAGGGARSPRPPRKPR